MEGKSNRGPSFLLAAAAAAVVALCVAAPVASGATPTLPSTWERGMNFTSWTADGYGSSSAQTNLRELAALGTDQVVLTPTWYMDTPQSDTVARDAAKTPTDASLKSVMADAASLGMKVVLKPHVDVRDGTFRGEIAPADRTAWFASYDAMVLHYAQLAQDAGARTLVVGTELTSMATDTASFTALIAKVRAAFDGTLTYAANWVDGAEQVGFWDRLDAIGIDAYMPLKTGSATPTVGALEAAWKPYVDSISNLHARTGKPVMFTELGYQSLTGALDNPADASGSPDPRLQAVAYTAALSVWRDVPWFQGISWWNWEAEPTGDAPAGSFSIAGKPAADILRVAQGGTGVVPPGVERSGMTVPTGASVLILTLLMGLAALLLVRRRRSRDPEAPIPAAAAPAGPSPALGFGRDVIGVRPARPILSLVENPHATREPYAVPALAPATQVAAGTLPPQLAAACQVPTGYGQGPARSTHGLPSTYHGVAA
jgi:hypothetical protein